MEDEKTHGRISWNASGMSLPWGNGVFHSYEVFSFQSGRKNCSIFVLYPRYPGFPNFSFATCELTPSCTPHMLYPYYHRDGNVKMLHQSSFIKTTVSNIFTLEDSLLEKALNVSLDLRACGCHKLTSPKVRPFSTIFSARQVFVSKLIRCCYPNKSILRILPLCLHDRFDNLFGIRSFSKIQEDEVSICLKCYVFKT